MNRVSSALASIAVAGCIVIAGSAAEGRSKSRFTAYHALKFTQAVAGLDQCGMAPMPIVYQSTMFKGGRLGSIPDYVQLKNVAAPYVDKAASGTAHKMVVLDVEGSWDLLPPTRAA